MVRNTATTARDELEEIRMALIVVQDMTTATLQVGHTSLSLASTVPVKMLLEHVATSANYLNGTFQLFLQSSGSDANAVRFSSVLAFNHCIPNSNL